MLPGQPNLQRGSSGPEVGNWQRFLNQALRSDLLRVDEDFGPKTDAATRTFQSLHQLAADGIVGPKTRLAAIARGFIEFVQASHFDLRWPRTRVINLVVIHTMECLELPAAGENVALWFAGRSRYEPPQASAHYCLDVDSTIQCVREMDVAWHAKQANGRSIGIEHAGFAKQSPAEWNDPYSTKLLDRSAMLVGTICRDRTIPVRRLTPDEVRSGLPGICGHIDVTNAYDRGVCHWDPGPFFPWIDYLTKIASYV